MPDWSYRTVFRPLLFRLPLETGRALALGTMGWLSRMPWGPALIDFLGHMRPDARLSRSLMQTHFPAPVGLGCMVDSHGMATFALSRFGAGFVEVGPIAVDPIPETNPVERRDDKRSIWLADSPASDGLDVWCARLSRGRPLACPCLARLVVAPGTQPEQATDDCRTMISRLRSVVDGFVVATGDEALSAGWTWFQWQAHVVSLVEAAAGDERPAPIWIALRADLDVEQIAFVMPTAGLENCHGVVVDGRTKVDDRAGWLIGAQSRDLVRLSVSRLRALPDGRELSVIAGGCESPAEALDLLSVGADLVLVDAGLVYSGPGLLKRINEAVLFAEHGHLSRSARCSSADMARSGLETEVDRPAFGLARWTWFWTWLMGLGLLLGGLLALGIASTRVILPYDEVFVGMSREELNLISPRLLSFMQHDRVTLSGTMLAVAVLYLSLSWYGIRRGSHWAMVTVLVSALTGFGSFFLFLGFGYFDPFHAFVTAIMFPFVLLAASARLGPPVWASPPNLHEERAWRLAQWGQLVFLIHGAVLIVAGSVISGVGCTTVFVQEDLEFMEVCPADLSLANPRLIPLIAHDRASFGGMLITTGVTVLLTSLWGFRQGARWQWWMLLLAGVPAYGLAIGVHLAVGYTSGWHLAPAYGGLAWLAAGLALLWPFLGRRDSELEREWARRLSVKERP